MRDVTAGLRQTGLIQFVGAPVALARAGLGGSLYRIRARLKPGFASHDYRESCREGFKPEWRTLSAESSGNPGGHGHEPMRPGWTGKDWLRG